ncbi:50S ribosomal protein L3 [bacterium]|nr:50S ribosomal protein L3 [bacterium]
MNFILGKKLEMTQIFREDGTVVPVTKIKIEPVRVLRIKSQETDGYQAVVLGYGKRNKIKKSLLGVFKNWGKFSTIKEFRFEGELDLQAGDQIGINTFSEGEKVKARSISKGKGFQGVVKRHGFHGTNEQHGNKDQSRMPGSIGATGPAHVFKGTKMGGRMGGDQVTVSGLEIIKIDLENNFLYLKGAIAGARNAMVSIIGTNELKKLEKIENKEEIKKDEKIENKTEEIKEEVKKVEEIKKDKKEDIKIEESKVEESKEEAIHESPVQEVKKEEIK